MNFQILKIILWPKNEKFSYKCIDFKPDKINIITGASRTGKSAIIPIIDYCLASDGCSIPVKTIRSACSWFGVLISTKYGQRLLARREPGTQKSTDDMFVAEGENIEIPKCPIKNSSAKSVKRDLDELFSLTFLDLEPDTGNNFNSRPSFRDMMAFCFQPQNVVANADLLFYKADTMEHRNKLINIFPYILGAVTPEVLAKRQEIERIKKELVVKERDLSRIKNVAENWKSEIKAWISMAFEYGLVDEADTKVEDFNEQINILQNITEKKVKDANIITQNIKNSNDEIVELRKEEREISMQLSVLKNRFTEMSQLLNSVDNYRESLNIQVERLSISKWMQAISDSNKKCPLCGEKINNSKKDIDKFYGKLVSIETTAGDLNKIPVAFEREYDSVQKEIQLYSEKLNSIRKRIQVQSSILNSSQDEKYTYENISRFLGRLDFATTTYENIGNDSELSNAIALLKQRYAKLLSEVDEDTILKKQNSALRYIHTTIAKLLPLLDSERPNDPVEFVIKDLTIRVDGEDGRKDYLWEIGSGSNWLAYHISVTLAFHIYFNKLRHSTVPNFIVYDQPSQVYFPQKLAGKKSEGETEPKFDNDEDKLAVKKIFQAMSAAIKEVNNNLQIIVLEHASEDVWGEVGNINKVVEWRGKNNKLIPEEWINEIDK